MPTPSIYNGITGAAGEFYVAAEVSKLGSVATLTIKNTPLVDVIATNLKNVKSANIQVKTRSINNEQGWRLTRKAEDKSMIKNLFYVFVNLKKDELSDYYIIPFNEFADFIKEKHKRWMKMRARDGSPHRDNDVRNFKPDQVNLPFFEADVKLGKKYKDKWDTLKIF